ncbi:MAG: hypothetical protein WBA07_06755 [Rivularia sp. (in: cyanobacteria)]
MIRSPREEFALSLGLGYRDGQTFIFDRIATPFGVGAEENGVTRTSVLRLGQDYLKRDAKGIFSARYAKRRPLGYRSLVSVLVYLMRLPMTTRYPTAVSSVG